MAEALLMSPSHPFVSLGATFTHFLQITQLQKKHLWVTRQAQTPEGVWEGGEGKASKANCQTENQLLSCSLGHHPHRRWLWAGSRAVPEALHSAPIPTSRALHGVTISAAAQSRKGMPDALGVLRKAS